METHGCISVSMADDRPTRCWVVALPALSRWERPRQNSSALRNPLSTSCSYSLFRSLHDVKYADVEGCPTKHFKCNQRITCAWLLAVS